MRIRKAKMSDVNSLIKFWEGYERFHLNLTKENYMKKFLQTNKNAISEMKDYFRKKIGSEDSEIFIAEDFGKEIGFIVVGIYDSFPISKIKKYGNIGYFFVKDNERGRGVGMKLYKKALGWFKIKRIKRIFLEINFLNERTIKFYKKLGLREFEISMIKDLD
jgi:GNAT superfamily N-acetyltransferase